MSTGWLPSRRTLLTTAGGLLASPALAIGRAPADVVDTEHGKLRGRFADGALSFKGVPYAADTGGANRFLPPRPVAPWSGVRDAFDFGQRCVQEPEGPELQSRPGDWFSWYGISRASGYGEDCCTLNIYTRNLDRTAKRPVMVYIHGGGFRSGGGDGPALDGSNLAQLGDVVCVTLNHRLNIFGYLQLDHLDPDFAGSANAGQLDLIAALRWIRTNIAEFGGDPDRVLLFGQSGGGSKIATLMIMPEAKGLLHRAVNMSGTTVYNIGAAEARQPITEAFLRAIDINRQNIRRLQQMPAQQLLTTYRSVIRQLKLDDYRPVVDGQHIPFEPLTPEGIDLHRSVPMIMGNTETEATLWLARDRTNITATSGELKARIKAQFGIDDAATNAVYEAYEQEAGGDNPWRILSLLSTDVLFRNRMLVGADAKVRAGAAKTYVYNFVWKVPVDGGAWGSPHAIDIPFAFDNVDRVRMMTGPGTAPEAVGRSLMSSFVAFARTGDPNGGATPPWRPYDTTRRPTMAVGNPSRLIDDYNGTGRRASEPLKQEAYQILSGPLFRGLPDESAAKGARS